jgi:hypothetical protein
MRRQQNMHNLPNVPQARLIEQFVLGLRRTYQNIREFNDFTIESLGPLVAL